jgi:hypothetical protein
MVYQSERVAMFDWALRSTKESSVTLWGPMAVNR